MEQILTTDKPDIKYVSYTYEINSFKTLLVSNVIVLNEMKKRELYQL